MIDPAQMTESVKIPHTEHTETLNVCGCNTKVSFFNAEGSNGKPAFAKTTYV